MVRALKWAGIVIGLIFGLAVLAVLLFDWNMVKGPLTERVTAATGREFAIEGDIAVDWSLTPHVTVNGIKLANAKWSERPQMVEIQQLRFAVELPELLRFRLVLPEVTIEKPVVVLEKNGEGQVNWQIGKKRDAAPDDRTEFPVIGRLAINDGQLIYRDVPAKRFVETTLSTVVGEGGEGAARIKLSGKGQIEDKPFTLDVIADSLLTLRDEDKPYTFETELAVGETKARLAGSIADPIKMEGMNVDLDIAGPTLAALFPILGIGLPETPPYSLQGHLAQQGKVFAFENFKGVVGDSDLSGNLRFDNSRKPLTIAGDLVSRNLEFNDLGPLIGIPPSPEKAVTPEQKRAAREEAADPYVLPDAPLQVKFLKAVNAKVSFRGTKIVAPNLPIDNVVVGVDLQNALLKLDPLKFGVAGGSIDGNIVLDARKATPQVNLDARVRDMALKRFFPSQDIKELIGGVMTGRIRLKGAGDTVRNALATSNGNVALVVESGHISNLIVELIGLDAFEALGIVATDAEGPVPIRCMVGAFGVEDGVLNVRTLVLDTTDTKVVGTGTANLGRETLDLKFTPYPKDVSLLSGRSPVTVQGLFKKPEVGIDPKGLVARGAAAAALGVLLTPAASVLAFLDFGNAKNSDCGALVQAAQEAAKQNPKAKPEINWATPRVEPR